MKKLLTIGFVCIAAPAVAAWDGGVVKVCEPQKDAVHCIVVLSDSASGKTQELDFLFTDVAGFSKAVLDAAVRARVATLAGSDTNAKKVAPGAMIDLATAAAPVPDKAEEARNTFLRDVRRWLNVKGTLVDTGILTGDEPELQALKSKIQKEYVADYVTSF